MAWKPAIPVQDNASLVHPRLAVVVMECARLALARALKVKCVCRTVLMDRLRLSRPSALVVTFRMDTCSTWKPRVKILPSSQSSSAIMLQVRQRCGQDLGHILVLPIPMQDGPRLPQRPRLLDPGLCKRLSLIHPCLLPLDRGRHSTLHRRPILTFFTPLEAISTTLPFRMIT